MTATLLVGGQATDADTARRSPSSSPISTSSRSATRSRACFARSSSRRSKADSNLRDADSVFITLLEAIIDRTADILEKVGAELDTISGKVFQDDVKSSSAARDYKAMLLRRLGRSGDLNSKVRESLVSIGRLVNFLTAECGDMHPDLRERTHTMGADIRSLADHATYFSSTTHVSARCAGRADQHRAERHHQDRLRGIRA